jgi:glycosyltransferase involved in cell wall biosynthesis
MRSRIKVAHVTTTDLTLRFLLLNQLQAAQREGYAVAGISSAGPWATDLERQGIPHHPIPSLSRAWNPLADLRAVVELARVLSRERFTVVHTHTPKAGVLGRLAARLSGVPLVVNTIHGLYGIDRGPSARWFFLSLERLAARGSDYEFCQSREDLDLLTRLGIVHPERSAYLGNGVDIQHFDSGAVPGEAVEALRTSLGIPPRALVVGTVGRLVWEKGYREFLAAAEQVRQILPEVTFLAVGPADEVKGDALRPEAVQRASAQGVRFLGWRSDMREVYGLMDVFVLASYREGFPRSAIEAAAMGKPLILTDIRGCREVVTPGQNGVLVPVREVVPLRDALLTLLRDPALRRRLGEESRRRALAEFDERLVVRRVLDVYRNLLATRNGASVQAFGAESASRR